VDLSKFKPSDWLLLGGGVLFLIGGFLDWITAEASVGGVGFSVSGGNAFDFFLTGIIPWILIVGAAVITALLLAGTLRPATAPWPAILVFATAVGALLVLIRFLVPAIGEDVPDGIDIGRGVGLWVCVLAAIASTVGAVLGFREAGGTLNDLTDAGKLRAAFNRPGASTPAPPPPPPPGSPTPPPPPPPPPAP
jgi:hypothetical protein